MRKISTIIFFVICLHFDLLTVLSQEANDVLTNAHVVEMVKAGIPEATTVLAIQQSETKFDTSAKALIKLKKLGVSQTVLEAMLNPRPAKSVSLNADENLPETSPNEIILFNGEKQISMKRSQLGYRYNRVYPLFGFSSKTYYTLSGIQSKLRVSDKNLEFEISLPSDVNVTELLVLIKLRQKSNWREVRTGKTTFVKSKVGFDKNVIVPTSYKEVKQYSVASGTKYKVYRVKVVNPLSPGEYAFAPKGLYSYLYDFGID